LIGRPDSTPALVVVVSGAAVVVVETGAAVVVVAGAAVALVVVVSSPPQAARDPRDLQEFTPTDTLHLVEHRYSSSFGKTPCPLWSSWP
jgi:hypothetical protein